jgi:hypothetical protein
MSGGRFDYKQYDLQYIADEIEQVIHEFERGDKSEWGDYPKWNFENPQTVAEFRYAIKMLKIARIYAQRIDWLLSADDGEDSFHKRLKHELEEILKQEEQK